MGNQLLNPFPQFHHRSVAHLQSQFKRLDLDNNGSLDPNQILHIPQLHENPLVQRVFSIFDHDKDGKISFKEFIYGLHDICGSSNEKKLLFAFKIYDLDEDGYISSEELYDALKTMVGTNLTNLQLEQLVNRTIEKVDEDCDGKISFQEFKKAVEHLDVPGKLNFNKI